jgi:sulfatase modifying factor 1
MQTTFLPSILTFSSLFGSAIAAVSIDHVSIGNPGNAGDTNNFWTPWGQVNYNYAMAKNETTIAQYAEFLNAVAKTDTYGLYNVQMELDQNSSGILRTGSNGSYSYSVIGSGNRPITYVNWSDAARFANWIHNGQPSGAQDASTTEDGAYTLNGSTVGIVAKNPGATVWLPSGNEFYKAAYYDPTKNGGAGGYWNYATRTDDLSNSNAVGVVGAANTFRGYYGATQSNVFNHFQNYLTEVGAYGPGSRSYYGTNDQTGNVREWTSEVSEGSAWGAGGGWSADFIQADNNYVRYQWMAPHHEQDFMGFRLATVPEPSSFLMTALLGTGFFIRRRH